MNSALKSHGKQSPKGADEVLTPEAKAFLAELSENFAPQIKSLLDARKEAQKRLDAGHLPDFILETRDIRESEWTVAPAPQVLEDRRVEITAPADAKKAILALNSLAKAYMADFEDSLAPSYANVIAGQVAMFGAARGELSHVDETKGKSYRLNPDHECQLIVRPRGWHLPEKNLTVGDGPIAGALFDFGLFMFHNAKILAEKGTGPFFYLPKLEHWKEAQLWDEVMAHAEKRLGLERDTSKVTVLIETLPAVFQMHEILHALKGRILGLNCGRWDYIFSYIKCLRGHGDRILPDRKAVTMGVSFLNAYSQDLVQACHRRGCHAMGGMAALIPINNDPEANAKALEGVRADKLREANNGHDGTWVAHPGLIGVAQKVFDEHMSGPNQKHVLHGGAHSAAQLLARPDGSRTRAQFDDNVAVSLHYMSAWLDGSGAVPINNLMEDAATAEISRSQLWQWIRHGADVDGERAGEEQFRESLRAATAAAEKTYAPSLRDGALGTAAELLESLVLAEQCPDFLTLAAYEHLD